MRKAIWVIAYALSFSLPSLAENEAAVIAVDVGHSFGHSGATSARGVSEFEFNSILATEIGKALFTNHTKVVLIGADGKMDDIYNRTALASSVGAKFFLSIHHDSAKPQYFRDWEWSGAVHRYADEFSGFSLFVSRKNPYMAESLKCASAIGTKMQEAGFHHSTYHSDPVAGENREWADQLSGVYYYDDLVVLKTATQPAVLLEAGVIVNRKEEEELRLSVYQERIANAVKAGLSVCGVIY
jgi:N-acetylmuramoyl-L-alanine amidase